MRGYSSHVFVRQPGQTRASQRAGFTVTELLVSIAIIGLLISLLLPAVQASREAARAVECRSHLKQIVLATANYEARHRVYPKHGDESVAHLGVFVFLLPDFGEAARFHSQYQPFLRPYQNGDSRNYLVGSIRPSYLTCPSWNPGDSTYLPNKLACYYGNSGWRFDDPDHDDWRWNGVITPAGPVSGENREFIEIRSSSITDGLSQTAMFSEDYQSDDREYYSPALTWNAYVDADACQVSTSHPFMNKGAIPWDAWAKYNHLLPPNQHDCAYIDSASSWHPGGCHVALCDGSVRFASETTDTQVWRALGTRDKSDLVGEF